MPNSEIIVMTEENLSELAELTKHDPEVLNDMLVRANAEGMEVFIEIFQGNHPNGPFYRMPRPVQERV